MTVKIRIPFKNMSIDAKGLVTGAPSLAENVIPLGFGYAPFKSFSALSTNALNSRALGAFATQSAAGDAKVFAGDASDLYSLSAGVFSAISKSGGYSVSKTEKWEFEQYGQRLIGTQIGAPPQYYDLDSSALFADLPGSPPQARHIAVVRDFVVFGNTVTSPTECYWSAFNNSGAWTKGVSQCDSQILQDGGWINKIVGGETGYIFQDRAITRMTYVGPPLIFQFDVVEKSRGLAAPGAIATVGSTSFYWSGDGFYSFDPVNGSQPIGNNLVDAFFKSQVSDVNKQYITTSVDPINKMVLFSFPFASQTDPTIPDDILIYNWISKEWTLVQGEHEMIFHCLTQARTLESLDTSYASIEDIPVSLDSRSWSGGSQIMGVFSTDHIFGTFQGVSIAATFQTAAFEPIPGKRSIITSVRPITDSVDVTAKIYVQERVGGSAPDSGSIGMESNGEIPAMISGRYHQVVLNIPASKNWTYFTALDVTAEEDGEI